MTPQDVMTELSDHGFADLGQIAMLRAINQAHKNICYRQSWPFLQKTLNLTFDGVNSVPLNAPSDLRAVLKIMDPVAGKRIRYMRTDDFEESYITTKSTVGTPILYYFIGNTLNFYQVPAATQTLYSRYLKTVADVGAGDPESAFALPPNYHEAIVFRALMRLYDLDDDSALSARFEAHYENVMAQMTDALLVLQKDEPEYIHVVDPDDYDHYWPVG